MLARNLDPGYIERQLQNLVPDGVELGSDIGIHFESALADTTRCISAIKTARGKGVDYLVSWQYSALIYFLSRRIWLGERRADVPVRLFLLNKALNGIDLFYEIDMPTHYCIAHTVGTVFAKARYGNYLVAHQHCTVGRQQEHRPYLEDGVVMFPGSSIIGNCHVRENTVLSAGVQLVNTSTPGNCYVFQGKGGRPMFKALDRYYADEYYNRDGVSDPAAGVL